MYHISVQINKTIVGTYAISESNNSIVSMIEMLIIVMNNALILLKSGVDFKTLRTSKRIFFVFQFSNRK